MTARLHSPSLATLLLSVGFGLALVLATAIFAGVFPYVGLVRLAVLGVAVASAVSLTIAALVVLYRPGRRRGNAVQVLSFGASWVLVCILEYAWMTSMQDQAIDRAVIALTDGTARYTLLSDIPDTDAREILQSPGVDRRLCGVTYLLGQFYLCARDSQGEVVFLVDISEAPDHGRSVRVFRR